MFCNQCEQAKHGVGCDLVAICGKPPEVSDLFDLLLWQLKGLATVHEKARTAGTADPAVDRFLIEGLFITVTNVNFDVDRVVDFVRQADAMTDSAVAAAGVDREDPALPEPVRFRTEGLGTTELIAEAQRHPITDFSPNGDIQSLIQLLNWIHFIIIIN